MGPARSDDLLRAIDALAGPAGERPSVTLDVSVMANRAIVQLMACLLRSDISLRVAYAEADVYHPTKAEFEANPDAWRSDDDVGLEQGVRDISVCPEHPGQHLDPLPDTVIVFPSFRRDRSDAVISYVDESLTVSPSTRVIWVLGVPHLPEDLWRLEAMRALNGLSSDGDRCPQYQVSTFDYSQTVARLEAIYREPVARLKDNTVRPRVENAGDRSQHLLSHAS